MSAPQPEPVLVRERRGAVMVARLNRPDKRNALNGELIRAIGAAVNDADADPEIRVLVITGTGDRAFCGGMDLRAFAEGESLGLETDDGRGFVKLSEGRVSVPVVGAANATAMAGGFELLLACDVIVASSEAEFGLPEAKRGLFAAGGGVLLGMRVALGVALELNLTGDPIGVQRAYDLGLVNAVVPPDQVMDRALAMAERIAANGPLALGAVKELVRMSAVDAERARRRMHELQPVVFASEDAKEGALAFVEKRDPVWRGR